MKEELYLLNFDSNGNVTGRTKLDISEPSGITLNIKSQLFGDLSKIEPSHSYSFTLPITNRNSRALDMLFDMRHESEVFGLKLKCQYVIDGLTFFNANLYVDKVQNGYNCCMTFNVIEGLLELQDNDINLQDLDNPDIEGNTFVVVDDNGNINSDALVEHFSLVDSFEEHFDNEAPVHARYENGTGEYIYDGSGYISYKYSNCPPAIPVRMILNRISDFYGLTFDLTDHITESNLSNCCDVENESMTDTMCESVNEETDEVVEQTIASSGQKYTFNDLARKLLSVAVVPLAKTSISDELRKEIGLIVRPVDRSGNPVRHKGSDLVSVDGESKFLPRISTTTQHAEYCPFEYFTQTDAFAIKVNKDCSLHIKGFIDTIYTSSVSNASIKVHKAEYIAVSQYQREFNLLEEIGDIEFINFSGVEMDETEGADEPEFEVKAGYYYLFQFSDKPTSFYLELDITPSYSEGNVGHYTEIYRNLPDISCMTFLKNLFYTIGAFPKVSANGSIGAIFYSDLKDNIANALDWSKRLTSDVNDYSNEISFATDSLCRHNYYLMKNENLEDKNDIDETEDLYSGDLANIECQNMALDKETTVIQFPFYGKFLRYGNAHSLNTGGGTKRYSVNRENTARNNGYVLEACEQNAVFGYLMFETFIDKISYTYPLYADIYGTGEYDWTTGSDVYKRFNENGYLCPYMEVWDINKSFQNDSYTYMQQILAKPYVIKVDLRLSIFELQNLDFAVPIYLEQYNSYFAIVNCEWSSTTGISKTTLIKLPNP